MMALVTVEQAKTHLRVAVPDESPQDAELSDIVDRASAIILDYLKIPADESPSWDESNAPLPVQQATLLMVSAIYDDRDGGGDGDYLRESGAIARLLRRFRDPSLA